MSRYVRRKNLSDIRIPSCGHLDLTYRCNSGCRHCWLSLGRDDPARERELSFAEITSIIDQARALGTRDWSVSGGEPLLRPDFPEIFDCLTARAASCSLNTNGTLITPAIARRLKGRGTAMIALYGATRETYDHITRHAGGFEKAMQGFRYLKEAGTDFIVQLVPLRGNWHEWSRMLELAQSLGRNWRVGAPWLYLSASRDPARNVEISRQRLDPRDVVNLDPPDMSATTAAAHELERETGDDLLFAPCIAARRNFHVDPYGGMSFCAFIKEPGMRYDLRRGTFREAWETFIPSLAGTVRGGAEYRENCAACDLRRDCNWCPVYGWLEHGRFSAPVEHLCAVARESRRWKEEWQARHRRYYRIAGIDIQVDSDLPFDDRTFHPKFATFRVAAPGADRVALRYHFTLPDLHGRDLGREVYRKPPWAIFQRGGSCIYLGISPDAGDPSIHRVATFSADHTRAHIYVGNDEPWRRGGIHTLTLFPSDQILIARLLADRRGCYLHSAGAVLDGAGMLFVGHSEAGKSTTTRLLQAAAEKARGTPPLQVEILCDDRNIVRRTDGGWRVFGTWSHGDVAAVSANDAPLRAICFIEKANENTLTLLAERREIRKRLLACVIRPFATADWWQKTLDLIERLADDVPCYLMRFDKSGEIVGELRKLPNRLDR